MTFKTLLVHAEPDWGSGQALDVALQMADLFGAHVLGVGAEAFDVPGLGYAEGELVQVLRDEVDVDVAAASKRFMTAVRGAPAGATFLSGIDRPYALMARHARGADLIVARRVPHDASSYNLCRPADLVMESGVPVLLAPRNAAPLEGHAVVVAWKDKREARRALSDALPFLAKAQKVQILQICEPDEHASARICLREIVDRLERHGVRAEVKVAAGTAASIATDIENAAAKINADLIVSGAFTHNRMQEWVLGGVTQDLLIDCSRYVLFSR